MTRKDLFAAYAQKGGGGVKRAPSTRTERLLLSVLSQVLEMEPHNIGVDENFFSLGGDSIIAIRFAQLARQHGIIFRVADVFRKPTISHLAQLPLRGDESAARAAPTAACPERYFGFESSEELRQAFFSSSLSCLGPQLSHDDVQDILPATEGQDIRLRRPCTYFILDLRGAMDNTNLQAACQALIKTHSILRTMFLPYQSKTAQVVLHERAIGFWRSFQCGDDVDLAKATDDLIKTDCIPVPPMGVLITQFTLVQGRDDDHRSLVVRLSHAQYDAFSISILLNDLKALLEGARLPEAPSFAAYLEECWMSKSERAIHFWRKLLRDSRLTHIGNKSCGTETQISSGSNAPVEVERTILLPSALPHGVTTLANLIKAAWSLVLSRLGNCRDVMSHQTTNGRHLASEETQGVVGLCIRRLPVRVTLDTTWTVLDLLRALQNQHSETLSFELVELRDLVEGPGMQYGSILVHQSVDPEDSFTLGQADCSVRSVAEPYPTDHILIESIPSNSHLCVRLITSSHILDKSGAEMVLQRLCDTIVLFARSPNVLLADIQMDPVH